MDSFLMLQSATLALLLERICCLYLNRIYPIAPPIFDCSFYLSVQIDMHSCTATLSIDSSVYWSLIVMYFFRDSVVLGLEEELFETLSLFIIRRLYSTLYPSILLLIFFCFPLSDTQSKKWRNFSFEMIHLFPTFRTKDSSWGGRIAWA